MTNTTRRAIAALLTVAAAAALTITAAAPASADTFPCQYDMSTPHELVVLGGTHDHPGARVTIRFDGFRTVHARLDHPDRYLRHVRSAHWTDANTQVRVNGRRCETT